MPTTKQPPVFDAPAEKVRELRALQRRSRRVPSKYRADPVGWVERRLKEHLWSRQRQIIESVRDHRYTAVPSCFATGKSFTAARTVGWWLDTNPAGDAFAVTTAPTFPQVRAILWREIRRAHKKGGLRGSVNQTEWWLDDEIVAFGRKPADTDPAAFQGIHARQVLVVLDEAAGIPKELWDAVDGLVANEDSRVLAIGNPDDSGSHFAEVCKPGSGWEVIPISAFDTPNFTEEDFPEELHPLLISPLWVEERKARWGEDSPLYKAKVLGEFPEDSEDGVVRASKVAACAKPDQDPGPGIPVELGVDPGAGGDFTSIRERRGRVAGRGWQNHSADPEEVVGLVVNVIDETGATSVKVDVIGIGHGIAGWVQEKRPAVEVVRVNVGESSTDKERFPKLRDQIWWEVGRELSEDGAWDLSAVEDDAVAQLLAPRYSIDASGRVKVEPKDETKKRLGRSPDDADALLLAFYSPVTASTGTSLDALRR